MSDAALLLERFVLILAVSMGMVALLAAVLLLLEYLRDPPDWWVRRQIPDTYDPKDWQPRGAGVPTDQT